MAPASLWEERCSQKKWPSLQRVLRRARQSERSPAGLGGGGAGTGGAVLPDTNPNAFNTDLPKKQLLDVALTAPRTPLLRRLSRALSFIWHPRPQLTGSRVHGTLQPFPLLCDSAYLPERSVWGSINWGTWPHSLGRPLGPPPKRWGRGQNLASPQQPSALLVVDVGSLPQRGSWWTQDVGRPWVATCSCRSPTSGPELRLLPL